jgi:hypothetical protein
MSGRKSGHPLLALEPALAPTPTSLSAPLEAALREAALHTEECANLTQPSSGCSLSSALGAVDKVLDAARACIQPSTIFQQGLVTPITPSFHLDSPAVAAPLNDQDSALCKLLLASGSATNTTARDPLTMLPPIPSVATPDSPEDFGFSFEEFEKRYVPLSHLPTPPLSDSASPKSKNSQSEYEALLDAEFLGMFFFFNFNLLFSARQELTQLPLPTGPAKYLAGMIPPNASSESPSAVTLAGILQRANLRPSVVALACCVLDCLSDQFIKRWKMECCNEYGYAERSEVLAVTALAVCMKFLEDSVRHPSVLFRRVRWPRVCVLTDADKELYKQTMGENHLRGALAGAVSKHNRTTGFDRPQILLPQHLKTKCDQPTCQGDSTSFGERRAVNTLGIRPGEDANIDCKNVDGILVASDEFTG